MIGCLFALIQARQTQINIFVLIKGLDSVHQWCQAGCFLAEAEHVDFIGRKTGKTQ
jgi:hypothetical protein